jgi:hypothetical protein
MRDFRDVPARLLSLLAIATLAACTGSDPIDAPFTPPGTGPRVVWDIGHRPLPEIPLPNDVATYPDPNSPTGLRVNASMIAPTGLESQFRAQFDELDGWGTYQAITIPFDDDLDLANIIRRHQRDDFDFRDDAVYLVDLETGLPVPLDLGEGNFQYVRRARDPLFANDPRAGDSNLVLETRDEDTNHDGILQPSEDTNFDGVMGRASVLPGGNPYDDFTGFWDASARVLIVRPLLPLRENHRYAVVVTERLVGRDGAPVRSPFPTITHPAQTTLLAPLRDALPRHPELYGALSFDIARGDAEAPARVAFAWAYTTQTTASELFAVRDGLYGRGPFAQLASIAPDLTPARANVGVGCSEAQTRRPYLVDRQGLEGLMEAIWSFSDPGEARRNALRESYRNVDYMVTGTFKSPFLMASDPRDTSPHAHWQLNARTGEVRHVGTATIPFLLVVPRRQPGQTGPFPVAFYTHGYGAGITEALNSAGILASHGVATIAIDGPTHGLPVDPSLASLARTFLTGRCVRGLADLLLQNNRARDLNGDGIPDPAGDFWTAYVVHSRDNVRQYALEIMQLLRALRGFDGRATVNADLNGDGNARNDLAGDFDGDGRVDVGGPDGRFYIMGESLGGIMSELLGGAEPDLRAATPFAGGGGLADVAIRSSQGGIKEAVYLRLMGPLVVGVHARDYGPRTGDRCTSDSQCRAGVPCMDGRCRPTRTACAAGQVSLRFQVTDVTDVGEQEFACANLADEPETGERAAAALRPGDDVVVQNLTNGGVRCARVNEGGGFRVGIPSDTGDRLSVQIYRGAVVQDFGTCRLAVGARLRAEVSQFRVIEGDCAEGCGHVPPGGLPESEDFHPSYRRVRQRGEALVSPAEGLGLRRQSPEFRRFLTLAQSLLDKGDPINFAEYYFLRRPPAGFTQPARHALINVNTTGDQNVPLNTGNAFSRAAGLLPFLRDEAPAHLRDYATPAALFDRYGRTPNRVLIDYHVLEGIHWLERHPVPLHPDALVDVDDLDEGEALFGERVLHTPLRLVRYARPVTNAGDVAGVWEPTLTEGGYVPAADRPVAATLNYYVRYQGHHSVDEGPRPDLPWDYTTYMYNLVGRFFASDGTDVYYRSHPATHRCLETNRCDAR